MVIAIWIFVLFIYFKVITAVFFSDGLNLFGSAVLSAFIGGVIFFSAGLYALEAGKTLARVRFSEEKPKAYIARSFPIFFASSIFSYVIGRFIIFGFDEYFHRDIELFYSRRGNFELEPAGVGFLCIFVIPLFIHWLTVLFPVLHAANDTKNHS